MTKKQVPWVVISAVWEKQSDGFEGPVKKQAHLVWATTADKACAKFDPTLPPGRATWLVRGQDRAYRDGVQRMVNRCLAANNLALPPAAR